MTEKSPTMRVHSFIVLLVFAIASKGHAQPVKVVYNDSAFVAAMLLQHNSYRAELRLPPLAWSAALADDAAKWAQHLAKSNKGEHDLSIRGQEGENLWWGTANAYSYTEMVGYWGGEKSSFVYGPYPNCSASRSAIVGHYTQIVWKNTQAVGCACASNGKTDFLVCRYSPAGNVIGQHPY